MTPQRMARLVAAWVRLYTSSPPAAAQRPIEEIDADLHDHIAHERARGTSERRIALGIAGRMARGVAAGVLVAGTGLLLQARSLPFRAAAVAIAVAACLYGNADDAPGLIMFGCLLIAGTVALAVRTALRSQ